MALDSDIACFQEMGNYEDFFKDELDNMGYTTLYYANKNKQHGCCIAFKKEKFEVLSSLNVELDEPETDSDGNAYCTKSTSTGNIGMLVALKPIATVLSEGCLIIGTCHLYWRPDCDYERLRQAHLFSRASVKFSQKFVNPSILICGDFNSQPYKLPYKVLTQHSPFDQTQYDRTVRELGELFQNARNNLEKAKELMEAQLVELAELSKNVDLLENEIPKVVTKRMRANKKLGPIDILSKSVKKSEREITRLEEQLALEINLMPTSEMCAKIQNCPRLISIYDSYASLDETHLSNNWGGSVDPDSGDPQTPILEPKFTHFTDVFRSTLDYIFLIEGLTNLKPTHILALPDSSEFGEGLPNLIHPSDHLPIMGIFSAKN